MADVLPINFPILAENNIISYNWVDIEEGTGVIIYYVGETSDSSANEFILTSQEFQSQNITYSVTRAGATVTENLSVDKTYESGQLNTPRVLEGSAFANVALAFRVTGSYSAGNLYSYAKIGIYKYSGGVESLIADNTTETFSQAVPGGSGVTYTKQFTTKILLPKTNLKIGDKLRVKVQIYEWHSITSATSVTTYFYQDSFDREDTLGYFTGMTARVPLFKIPHRIES